MHFKDGVLLSTWPVKMVTEHWSHYPALYTTAADLALVGYSQECHGLHDHSLHNSSYMTLIGTHRMHDLLQPS